MVSIHVQSIDSNYAGLYYSNPPQNEEVHEESGEEEEAGYRIQEAPRMQVSVPVVAGGVARSSKHSCLVAMCATAARSIVLGVAFLTIVWLIPVSYPLFRGTSGSESTITGSSIRSWQGSSITRRWLLGSLRALFIDDQEQKDLIAELERLPMIDKPMDPFFLDFHMTRYYGGYFINMDPQYNPIVPWLRNFDIAFTKCGIEWPNPAIVHGSRYTCGFVFDPEDSLTVDQQRQRRSNTSASSSLELVHVHIDPPHLRHFVERILPYYERRFEATGKRILLHTGGGDMSIAPGSLFVGKVIQSAVVARWAIENNIIADIANHVKVIQVPIGIGARENRGQTGRDLRAALERIDSDPSAYAWNERKDRVLFCFHKLYDSRLEAMQWASGVQNGCDVCDVCDSPGEMTHADLWALYASYRYVYSPYGNGVDCGRSWEIMLLGAVPVMPYFAGALGYLQGNLTIVTVGNVTEVTRRNVSEWSLRIHGGTERFKLSKDYWERRIFDTYPT